MKDNKKIGLSLSGGGYRATAYHLGTLKKLKEMGVLEDVDVISSVSGGSITSAYYALNDNDFSKFEVGLLKGVRSSVIKGVLLSRSFLITTIPILVSIIGIIWLLFTEYAWLSTVLIVILIYFILKFQFSLFPLSDIIEDIYNKFFFSKKKLSDFGGTANVVINSTNMETGRLFSFSKNKMSDSSYEYPRDKSRSITFNNKNFPVARAVAASTCVPFAFTPISINKEYFNNTKDINRAYPRLVDGGVYDNQGIHKLTQEGSSYLCDIIITSDAGSMLPFVNKYKNTIQLLARTSEIFMNRIKDFQFIQNVYNNTKYQNKEIAYFSLGWNIEGCIPGFISNLKKGNITNYVIEAHGITQEEITNKRWNEIEVKLIQNVDFNRIISQSPNKEELKIARSVKTNLTALKQKEINALIKHASSITELQVSLYCPSLIK